MLLRRLLWCALAAAFGCTNIVVEDETMKGDHRIFDKENRPALLGQVFTVSKLMQMTVQAAEGGATLIRRPLAGLQIGGKEEANSSNVTLAVESFPLTVVVGAGTAREVWMQGILEFGTGQGQQGNPQQTTVAINQVPLDSRILFDISSGTFLAFPASYLKLNFLYVARNVNGFVAGATLPDFALSVSMGYEPKTNVPLVTWTDVPVELNAAAATAFNRPKYAQSVEFTWDQWANPAVTPLSFTFSSVEGASIWSGSLVNNVYPPPRLPWPADAVAVVVTNASGVQMQNLRARNYLAF